MQKKRDDGIPVREACVKKWFLVMKLICVFTLFLLLKVSANGFSQKKISLDFEKASMLEIIQELRQQTGYKFFFNHNELKKVKDVSVKFVDEELEQVLDVLLGKVNLSYRIEQGVIIIVPGEVKNEEREVRIIGKVTDERKQPLPGVTVRLENTNMGTATNFDGVFSFRLPVMNGRLILSFVGYKTKEVEFKLPSDTLKIVLEEEVENVEEVVVTGYFNKAKESFTGSEVTIESEELKKVGALSITQALSAFDPSIRLAES